MKSKTLMWFKPLKGFAKAKLHSFIFSALILTVAMVGVSFACGSNPLFGYYIKDIAYSDFNSIAFAAVIAVCAFVYACFIFVPFTARNESDTFLSLPIKKSSLIAFQAAIGLFCITFSGIIAYGLIFPALNLTKFTSVEIYLASVKSLFCEILLPMAIMYMTSVILIMKTGNFLSSFLIFAAISLVSFFSGDYINSNVGFLCIGADVTEITNSVQNFYFSAQIFLPVRLILCLIKAIFPVTAATANIYIIGNFALLFMLIITFVTFGFAIKSVILGEMNRPFAVMPMLKTLPIFLLIIITALLYNLLSPLWLMIIGIAAALAVGAVVLAMSKSKRKFITCAALSLIITVFPLSMTLCNRSVSDKITDDIPDVSDIKAVYFNPVYPSTTSTLESDLGKDNFVRANRYCFKSDEAKKIIVKIHGDIVKKIDELNLKSSDKEVKLNEEVLINPNDALEFSSDDYANYRKTSENTVGTDKKSDQSEQSEDDADSRTDYNGDDSSSNDYDYDNWGLFDKANILDTYFSYIFDYDNAVEIEPNKVLSVIGNEVIDPDVEEIPKYIMTVYYQLNDGRWIKRFYSPVPKSWVESDMINLLKTSEFQKLSGEVIK